MPASAEAKCLPRGGPTAKCVADDERGVSVNEGPCMKFSHHHVLCVLGLTRWGSRPQPLLPPVFPRVISTGGCATRVSVEDSIGVSTFCP